MTDPAIAEALDLLGLEVPASGGKGEPPPGRLFEELFIRFQARVPFREGAGPLSASELLSRWAADGSGGGPSSRTEALLVLANVLGFDVRPVSVRPAGSGAKPRPVLLAHLGPERRRVLADAGLPMPGLLPLDAAAGEGFPTGYGRVRTEDRDGRTALALDAFGGEETLWTTELTPMPVEEFPPDAAGGLRLFRLLGDRFLRWEKGRLEVGDAWSRLDVPFAPGRETLGELFAQPIGAEPGEDGSAFLVAGEGPPTLTVREGRDGDAARIRALLATPEGHEALLPPGVVARGTERVADGWDWILETEDGVFVRRERVRTGGDATTVETLEGAGPFSRRRYQVEELPGAWRVRLEAEIAGAIPPRGVAEGARKGLAFALVSEILAIP